MNRCYFLDHPFIRHFIEKVFSNTRVSEGLRRPELSRGGRRVPFTLESSSLKMSTSRGPQALILFPTEARLRESFAESCSSRNEGGEIFLAVYLRKVHTSFGPAFLARLKLTGWTRIALHSRGRVGEPSHLIFAFLAFSSEFSSLLLFDII